MFNVVYLLCLVAQDMYNVQIVHVIFHSHMMNIETPLHPSPTGLRASKMLTGGC